jgi:hypothetical protein
MSFGGVLGGIFNALVAPVIFNSIAEFPLILVVSCMLLPPVDHEKPSKLNFYLDIGLAIALGCAALYALPKLVWLTGENGEWVLRDPKEWLTITGFGGGWLSAVIIFVVFAALVAYGATARRGQRLNRWLDVGLPLALGILTAQLVFSSPFRHWEMTWLTEGLSISHARLVLVLTYGLPVALCYGLAEQPIRFGLGVGAIFLAGVFCDQSPTVWRPETVVHQERSFFGVLKVEDERYERLRGGGYRWVGYERLLHGTTLHGMQRQDNLPLLLLPLTAADPLTAAALTDYGRRASNELRLEPLTYYHHNGPIGQAYVAFCQPDKPVKVAFVGLGTGSLAS